jgi:hypothetical protein
VQPETSDDASRQEQDAARGSLEQSESDTIPVPRTTDAEDQQVLEAGAEIPAFDDEAS